MRHPTPYLNELLKPDPECANKLRLAFAKAHANELWQADTLYGPHALYGDNGAIYSSKEILQICARVGCLLHHTPVRDGAAKGKVERCFRTVRDQFLARDLDLNSLDALNRQFTHWVEEQYNAQLHSVLGLSPLDRLALDRKWLRFLPPNEANDERFFVEEERHVRADNTFSFKAQRWEAPRHLPDRTIHVRSHFGLQRNPFDPETVTLLAHQQEVIDILRVHAQQGGLGHNPFTPEALALIVRSGDGLLRRTRKPLPQCAHRSRPRPNPHRGSPPRQPRPHSTPLAKRL